MAYAVKADLNLDDARLAELTDSPSSVGVVNDALVTRALQDASDRIDTRLAGKYVVPIVAPVQVPSVVRQWTADIGRYFLFRRREKMPMPEIVRDDYKRALEELDMAADRNDVVLPLPRVNASTAPSPTGGALEDVPRFFGRGRDGLG